MIGILNMTPKGHSTLPTNNSVYEQVAHITDSHFGREAIEYFEKFISTHLQKPAHEITKAELVDLIDWIRITATFFVEDIAIIDHYVEELLNIESTNLDDE